MPKVAHIRTDLRVPVLMLETETDLFGLGFYKALQPDTDRIRTWQMAGTAHADQSTLDYGIASGRQWDKTSVDSRLHQAVREHQRRSRALHRARRVLRVERMGRERQPRRRTSPAIKVIDDGSAIARDAHGNAIGGIRTPAVDVPIESLSGENGRRAA